MIIPSQIRVARFPAGVVIRIEGPGTIGESPVVHAFAGEVLRDRSQRVVLDVSGATYMDSTFLGGLISRFRRHGAAAPGGPRFAIYAPEAQRAALFGQNRLDSVLPFTSELPVDATGGMLLQPSSPDSSEELARYVVDCHRRLAELGGPEAPEYSRVADAIAAQLDGRRR